MKTITIDDIKKLREITGAGINACKEALESTNGDFDQSLTYLRQKGMMKSLKRKDNAVEHGCLGVYKHNDSLMVVVLLSCETDFAAQNSEFKKLAYDLALHIAATSPQYIYIESIPADILESEKKSFESDLEGKSEKVISSIIEGRLQKYYTDTCLVKQKFFLDETKTIEDLINEFIAKLGEKIQISYFYKFDIKSGIQSASK
jgi:elongation factor Ts